jgi:dTDP-4-dehydrorhamnose reductase
MARQVLVTGAQGQLGKSIQALQSDYPQFNFVFTDIEELDLSSQETIQNYLANNRFDVIINCAAYTAVDKAESEQKLADQINHQAVKTLAEIAKQQNSTLIHISTDYVFNGENFLPYTEPDQTNPKSVYGETKLKGEQVFLNVNPYGCIIRTSWVYSEYGNNFVKTMLRLGKERDELGVIFDQVGTPTYAGDLAEVILGILASELNDEVLKSAILEDKIYHLSNEGVCSWYDFAKTIFELSQIECFVNAIETQDYPTPAKRPHYSVMNKNKIKLAFNLRIPYWKDSLKMCLKIIQEAS